jgi:phenylacetate-coenzyme A ligase PaaK-like adenylate-forming protein
MRQLILKTMLRRNPTLTRKIAELERTQWMSRDEVLAAQLEGVRSLLEHAATHVPYYRETFARVGFRAADLRRLDDLRHLPELTKQILQEQGERLIADTVPRASLLANHSGGSTGLLTNFYLDSHALQCARAAQWRFYRWAGLELGDPHVFIWGAPSDLKTARRLRARVQNWVLQRTWFDAFSLDEQTLEATARAIIRRAPRVISGYASALGRFTDYCVSAGVRLPSLRGIVSTAEVLPPARRAEIESTFGVHVYDRYGCGEMKDIAQECGEGGAMHMNTDNVLVEVVPGSGEILATNLVNFAMPLIRYRMGDVGELVDGSCPCGRGLPRMRLSAGRISEGVLSPDGTWIHGEYFTHLFYGIRGIRQFQLTQHAIDDVEVRVSTREDLDTDAYARLQRTLAAKLRGVNVRYVVGERLEASPSGKYLFVRSALRAPRATTPAGRA